MAKNISGRSEMAKNNNVVNARRHHLQFRGQITYLEGSAVTYTQPNARRHHLQFWGQITFLHPRCKNIQIGYELGPKGGLSKVAPVQTGTVFPRQNVLPNTILILNFILVRDNGDRYSCLRRHCFVENKQTKNKKQNTHTHTQKKKKKTTHKKPPLSTKICCRKLGQSKWLKISSQCEGHSRSVRRGLHISGKGKPIKLIFRFWKANRNEYHVKLEPWKYAVWMQHVVSISSSRRKNRLLRSVRDLLLSEQWHDAEHDFCPIKQIVELCHKEERHW